MVFIPYSFKDRWSNSTQQQANQPTSQRRSQNVGFSGQSITTTRTPATTSSQLHRVVTCAQTPSQQRRNSQEDVSTSIIQPRKLVEDSSVAKSSQSSQSLSTKENVPSNLQQVVGQEQLNKFSEQCRKTHELESSLSASKGNSLVHKKKLELETRPGW